ncbi:hypothetical protein FLJU110815_01980 [Flavobacterium jumunjinense]
MLNTLVIKITIFLNFLFYIIYIIVQNDYLIKRAFLNNLLLIIDSIEL